MAEEVMEYIIPEDTEQVEQVDALVDLLYFVLGTFTMMGFDPFNDARLNDMAGFGRQLATELYENGEGYPPADRLYMGSTRSWRAEDGRDVMELIFEFARMRSLADQITSLRNVMNWTLVQAAVVGADLYPYMIIVHDANMGKLGPDGKPSYRSDGKIIKPAYWKNPKNQMVTKMLNDLDEEAVSDEVPF